MNEPTIRHMMPEKSSEMSACAYRWFAVPNVWYTTDAARHASAEPRKTTSGHLYSIAA